MRSLLTALLLLVTLSVNAGSIIVRYPECVLPWQSTRAHVGDPCPSDSYPNWNRIRGTAPLPTQAQIDAWRDEADFEIKLAFLRGDLAATVSDSELTICWNIPPVILTHPVNWYYPDAWYGTSNGPVAGPACAAEENEPLLMRVVVATNDRDYIRSYVRIGVFNVRTYQLGRPELLDRWHPAFVDPLADHVPHYIRERFPLAPVTRRRAVTSNAAPTTIDPYAAYQHIRRRTVKIR
jgi:hypothetical protein